MSTTAVSAAKGHGPVPGPKQGSPVTVDVQSMTRDNLAETWTTNVGVDPSEQIAEALAADC